MLVVENQFLIVALAALLTLALVRLSKNVKIADGLADNTANSPNARDAATKHRS